METKPDTSDPINDKELKRKLYTNYVIESVYGVHDNIVKRALFDTSKDGNMSLKLKRKFLFQTYLLELIKLLRVYNQSIVPYYIQQLHYLIVTDINLIDYEYAKNIINEIYPGYTVPLEMYTMLHYYFSYTLQIVHTNSI